MALMLPAKRSPCWRPASRASFSLRMRISGKIFFGGLPSLVRVSIPFERVLKYGASQRAYHRIRCFSGNVGHVFDIHTAQIGKAENEGIGYAARATAAGPVRPGGCTPAAASRRRGGLGCVSGLGNRSIVASRGRRAGCVALTPATADSESPHIVDSFRLARLTVLRTAGRIKRLAPVKGQVDTGVVCHNIHR